MTAKDLKKYLPLLTALDGVIAAAHSAKLGDTAALLRLARRDLTLRASGIAADEIGLVARVEKLRAKPVRLRTKRPARAPH